MAVDMRSGNGNDGEHTGGSHEEHVTRFHRKR
jgi:hypothetical protein